MAKILRQIDDEELERPFDKGQFTRLLRYLIPFRKKIALAIVLMIVATTCSLATTFLLSNAIEELLYLRGRYLPYLIGGMFLTAGIGALCTRYRVRLMDTSGRSALAKLREDLFGHIQSLSFSFFDTRSAGKILVRVINDVNSLNDLFTNGIVNVLVDCLTLVLLLVIMFFVNWKLTLISMCIMPLLVFIMFKLKRVMRLRWQVVRMKTSSMNGYLHESLAGMRVTEAFVREEENFDTFTNVNSDIRNTWMKRHLHQQRLLAGAGHDRHAGHGVGVLRSAYCIMRLDALHPLWGLTTCCFILWYLGRFWEPLNTLSNFYNYGSVGDGVDGARSLRSWTPLSDVRGRAKARSALPPISRAAWTFDARSRSTTTHEKPVLKGVSFDHRSPGRRWRWSAPPAPASRPWST